MTENEISAEILDAAIAVCNSIGRLSELASRTVSKSAAGSYKPLCALCAPAPLR